MSSSAPVGTPPLRASAKSLQWSQIVASSRQLTGNVTSDSGCQRRSTPRMQRQLLHCVARMSAAIGLPGSTDSAAVVSRIHKQKSVITPLAVAHARISVFIICCRARQDLNLHGHYGPMSDRWIYTRGLVRFFYPQRMRSRSRTCRVYRSATRPTPSNYRKSFSGVELFSQAGCVAPENTRIA